MANQESSQNQPPQGPPPSSEAIELLLDILRRINKEVEVPALEGSALKVAEFYQKLVADLAPGSVEPDRRLFTVVNDLFAGTGPSGYSTTQQKSGS